MSKFEVKHEGQRLRISGYLDEDADFPIINLSSKAELTLDLKEVKSVNSVGIRTWLNWITPLSAQAPLIFENVPHALVLQINMIEGFLPKSSRVHSFYAPIYSENADEEGQVLLVVGKDIVQSPNGPTLQMDLSQVKGEGDWEFDVIEKTYFKFLNT